jgi:membrane protein implicated in regulation of membrane protease activity
MGRLIVLVLLVVVAVWLVRRALRGPAEQTHLRERAEAGGLLYCSDEHARLGKR